MTLQDIVARLEHISATSSVWARCEECKEEARVDYSEMERALAELRLDIEIYLAKQGQL
jgi:hypothetical protein